MQLLAYTNRVNALVPELNEEVYGFMAMRFSPDAIARCIFFYVSPNVQRAKLSMVIYFGQRPCRNCVIGRATQNPELPFYYLTTKAIIITKTNEIVLKTKKLQTILYFISYFQCFMTKKNVKLRIKVLMRHLNLDSFIKLNSIFKKIKNKFN